MRLILAVFMYAQHTIIDYVCFRYCSLTNIHNLSALHRGCDVIESGTRSENFFAFSPSLDQKVQHNSHLTIRNQSIISRSEQLGNINHNKENPKMWLME